MPIWLGGWTPRHGAAIGIALAVDPLGAGAATLAGLLVLAAMVFSWRYFETVGPFFHALMLAFLSGMVGFTLTGDLFNMFVFFELMSVAAYALTGYSIEEPASLQGALNFAVVNTIGGLFLLTGVGLLYGRTGALNMAQLGEALAGRPADGLVIVAFSLIATAFLVKAAAVPFHFWLGDAYSVAPAPVGIVFAGTLSELGLYGLARVYWTVFAGSVGTDGVRPVLLVFGAITALIGAVMCVEQRNLKRLVAFATVSHSGLILIGLGLLEPPGLAGAAIYLAADGAAKAALFVCLGILMHRLGNLDEDDLLGKGRRLPYTAVTFAVCGLALAGLPPFGTALGKGMMEEAAGEAGYAWVASVFVVASILTGGAALRAAGRIFLGLGGREPRETPAERAADEERPETRGGRGRTPMMMASAAGLLLLTALAIGLWPRIDALVEARAHRFEDRDSYASAVLAGQQPPAAEVPSSSGVELTSNLLTAVGAVGVGLLGLYRHRIPEVVRGRVWGLVMRGVEGLRTVHSGELQDYVAWLTVGFALLGGAFALTVR